MAGTLEGKVALVTGASRGIGRAVAAHFARSGAFVVGSYANNAKAAEQTAAAIKSEGGKIAMIQAEFTEAGAVETLLKALDAALMQGPGSLALDILVNNAGGGEYAFLESTTEKLYDDTFERNTRIPFFLVQALLPRLRSGGSIINMSSEGVRLNLSEYTAYGMAKSSLEFLTRALAKEIGPRGIRVNAICPGIIRTDSNEDFVSIDERRKEIEEATALRRIGHVDDIAGVIHALVSPACSFVTGQVIEVSGGFKL